jgi:ketosteroid isomerase-like protein
MSHGNIETLRRGHRAFSRGDQSAMIAEATPDSEWRGTGGFAGVAGVYWGADGIREWMDVLRSEWEDFAVSLDEVLYEGDDLIVVTERIRGRGRASGAQVEMCVFSAYWFEDGKISKRAAFGDRQTALKAAGLSE